MVMISCNFVGVNKQYDQALSDISRIEQQLEDYLNRQRKRLACKVTGFLICNKLVLV